MIKNGPLVEILRLEGWRVESAWLRMAGYKRERGRKCMNNGARTYRAIRQMLLQMDRTRFVAFAGCRRS